MAKDDPLVTAIANFAHFMYDAEDRDTERAKGLLKDIWELVRTERTTASLTREFIDRCSEGGFAVHYPSYLTSVLNCFIKQAPSLEWAEQAYRFALYYSQTEEFSSETEGFKMARAEKPFVYDDGGLVLYVTDFVPGLDLDSFFLNAAKHGDKYAPYVRAVADKSLDDIVYWQADAHNHMKLPKPTPNDIKEGLRSKIYLAVQNARRFGGVPISDDEMDLLNRALQLFDGLELNEATIVPILDNCPKNQGIETDQKANLDDTLKTISTEGRPDGKKIAKKYYHWDPAAKWGHFLEDHLAFFGSYELGRFRGKGVTDLKSRLKEFLQLKQVHDETFSSWAKSISPEKPLEVYLSDTIQLMQFYRALRKADLSATRYAWRNENLVKGRLPEVYGETRVLLPNQIAFYGDSAMLAMTNLINSSGDKAKGMFDEFRIARGDLSFFEGAYSNPRTEDTRLINALYLLHIASRLTERRIDYSALSKVENPSIFTNPRGR